MRKITSLGAFTLIELLVVISIIGILALGLSNINIKRLSQNQQVSIETVEIINLIEEARNNALIGKGVGVSLNTPESWRVIIENTSSSGSMLVQYFSGSYIDYKNWIAQTPYSITNLECQELDGTPDSSSGPYTLIFTGSTGGISGCSNDNYKKINFDFGLGDITENITLNSLTGVIEKD